MPTVLLAGYNVDAEVLAAVRRGAADPGPLTPETISAAYARISRDPRPVDELRAEARAAVDRARLSNERIVFGYGHQSVAEHAVFNFDLIGLSRLAIEAVEAHRLASYTEKSQRYVRLGEDFVVPAEVASAGLEAPFRAFVHRCFAAYRETLAALEASGVPERLAAEDARYVLPLATAGQLGMTVNARTLERMVLRLSAHPLAEVRAVGHALLETALPIAPSLLRHVAPGPYDLRRQAALDALVRDLPGAPAPAPFEGPEVRLVFAPADGDDRILAALAAPSLQVPAEEAVAFVRSLGPGDRERLFDAATRHLGVHDPLPREFEHAALTFDVVLSAAGWGQLKRHRMTSPDAGPYDPALGLTVPASIEAAGVAGRLAEAAAGAADLFGRLGGFGSAAAPYALLNAHRRRILLTVNLRELYHLSRLREDAHAQWDVRQAACAMSSLARRSLPVCASLLGGKDAVEDLLRRRGS